MLVVTVGVSLVLLLLSVEGAATSFQACVGLGGGGGGAGGAGKVFSVKVKTYFNHKQKLNILVSLCS